MGGEVEEAVAVEEAAAVWQWQWQSPSHLEHARRDDLISELDVVVVAAEAERR